MNETLDIVSQIVIATAGLTSIVLIARKNKWGFVAALIAQPFWFITTFTHKQWGIFLLSFAYTASWLYGFYEWFYKPSKKTTTESTKT